MRRAVLACVVGATAALAASPAGLAADCRPTPNDSGGPDRSPPLRATIGTGHVLTGVVLSPVCSPIAGARVSFWQSNARGMYTPAGAGAVITTRAGRFRFQGPRPTSGGGFPGHIHIKVQAAGYETLYTEYFPPAGSRRGSVRLVLVPAAL
jgi:protocatechuate 3,4-dioxygenase beta subunit